MKKLLLGLLLALAVVPAARAENMCTLIVDAVSGETLYRRGSDCDRRASPASTFKVPLAVMGFDSGVLTAPDTPAWPYKSAYNAPRKETRVTTTPTSWLSDSVLWYSQVLVSEMGGGAFARYVRDFDFGNADVSGDPGKDNGLSMSWVDSSLQVTPREQVTFMRKLLAGDLPVSDAAQAMTLAILPRFEAGGWSVAGKTGSFSERKSQYHWGWFVGFAERGNERVVVARLIRNPKGTGYGGIKARDQMLKVISGR